MKVKVKADRRTPRRPASVIKCTGEAHSNMYIDNCMVCAPRWGEYYSCPACTGKLDTKMICRNPECVAGGEKFLRPI